MESLQLRFPATGNGRRPHGPVLVGVVGSGNLEILVEPGALEGACEVRIDTSVRGFEDTWRAVLERFLARHPLADTRISINDGGATPAVVSLRLEQMAREIEEGSR
jgi:malonate decarboxylase delta subunit